jgi:hypothetical protein
MMIEMNQTNELGENESFISSGNSNNSSNILNKTKHNNNNSQQQNSSHSNKSKNNILIINDSDYKSTRQSKIKFSTAYLTFKEEIKLMLYKNFTIYLRNVKTLIFLFITPVLFLTILQILQSLSDLYNQSVVTKDHKITNIDFVNLSCLKNPYDKYEIGCISIGIAILVINSF